MGFYVGLDVALRSVALCVIDGDGKIKALSRDASYVIVCTSFFRENPASSLPIREIIGRELQFFRAFAMSRCPSRHRNILQLVRSA
ncbi:hypothetical protein [Parasphingorhabdus cellanae]|uniref:Transposase IS111A/IS1328/IS1533 N-terminal domain-containing protein n=1 Tax=Parasphingorhabdus cellanae TaxID=2806553 RepID=A0ABX7T9P0_9SPHN|nr:hypothetical protein [Parasphingorhabdus cellanae]QTD57302.1 hypothetical protein J4G78_07160 [Parasphingorhabdus cellanae]